MTCSNQGTCSTYNANKGFYRIPEHPVRRKEWLDACKLPPTTANTASICWKHFNLSDFKNEVTEENIKQCKFGQLKKNVVPSQNLPDIPVDVTDAPNQNLGENPEENLSEDPQEFFGSDIINPSVSTSSPTPSSSPSPTPKTNVVQNESTSDQNDHKKIHGNQKSSEKPNYLKALQEKDAEIRKLRKQNQLLKNKNTSLMSGNLPMTVKKKAATEVLQKSAKYSDAQISQMIKPKKTDGIGKGPYRGPRCNNWGYSDWAKGLKQKMHSRKAYQEARKNGLFHLPGISTLNRIFRDLVFQILKFIFK